MNKSTVQQYFLVALLFAVGIAVFYIFKPFLAPLALAGIFAVVLQPVYLRAQKELRGSKTLAALSTVLIFLVVILLPVIFLGQRLFVESQHLYTSVSGGEWRAGLDSIVQNNGPRLDAYIPGSSAKLANASAHINVYIADGVTWLIQHVGVAFTGVSSFILALVIFFLTLYYLLADGPRLCRYLVRLSPLADSDDEMILQRLEVSVNAVVRGKLLIALIQGVFSGVGFWIFGVPNPIFWALAATIAALIPPFGTGLIVMPAALYIFLTGDVGAAIGLAMWGVVAGVIDNIIGPKLMSSGDQHPLLMLLSVIGGIAFFGPVGVFLGPLMLSLFLTLLSLHIHSAHT